MMKARANALKLNWRNQGTEEVKKCPLCNQQTETIEHFLIGCDELQETRNKYTILQRPINNNPDSIINKMLLFDPDESNINYFVNIIADLWQKRKLILQKQE